MTASPKLPGNRFDQKRAAIIAAGTELLNERGVKGLAMPEVAERVDLSVTGITYYFRRKEDLAIACLEAGIDAFDDLVRAAATASDPPARVHALLTAYLDAQVQIRRNQRGPIAVLSDIRALSRPASDLLTETYRAMLVRTANLFVAPGNRWMSEAARIARAQMLLEQLYWSAVWLNRYDNADLPRVRDRMLDLLLHGLCAEGRCWQPHALPREVYLARSDQESGHHVFLQAATRLINRHGYGGASVERIAAELNVTKGSFYHHVQAKDDLVAACFRRSFNVMRRLQRWLLDQPDDQCWKLATAASELVAFQLSEDGPLLRTSALSGLPGRIQFEMVSRSNRISYRFAGMISDGWAEGSVRPVDPYISSQMLMAMINAAADLPTWIPSVTERTVGELYARPLFVGIFER